MRENLAALLFALYVFPTDGRRAGYPARSGREWLPKDLHYHHYIVASAAGLAAELSPARPLG